MNPPVALSLCFSADVMLASTLSFMTSLDCDARFRCGCGWCAKSECGALKLSCDWKLGTTPEAYRWLIGSAVTGSAAELLLLQRRDDNRLEGPAPCSACGEMGAKEELRER